MASPTEIAKYDAEVQQEVYEEHFSDGCRLSWKNARIKEIARRLYDRYMTRLDTYRFDKTECHTCHHNTANQILFKDECTDECAGCQNRSCMMRKNDEYLGSAGPATAEGGSADGPCHGGRYPRFGNRAS